MTQSEKLSKELELDKTNKPLYKQRFFVKKKSSIYKDLRELKANDMEFSRELSEELVVSFGDDWRITCDHIGKPEYVHSTKIEVEGWHKDKDAKESNQWIPDEPSTLWENGFFWQNDAISRCICGEAIYIFLDKETLSRGFKVCFEGKHIFLECDKRILRHITLRDGLKEAK